MSKRIGMLVGLLSAVSFVAGCTSSTSPTEPADTAAPAAVQQVTAQAVSGGLQLTWAAGAEADLEAYRVYRSTGGGSAALVAVRTTTSYVDTEFQTRTVYRYQITAVDHSGNESARGTALTVYAGRNGGHNLTID